MSLAREIDRFFRETGQEVFIEAEARGSRMMDFIDEYRSLHGPLDEDDEGIILLSDDKDKWGLELRCYFQDRDGFPEGIQTTSNRAYRSEYPYRFNDNEVIEELFDLGYRIGLNG